METKTEDMNRKLAEIARDVEFIKEMLLDREDLEENELTAWAKNELEEARRRKVKIPHEEVKRIILQK